jgi:ATP-dependent DNA helicase RecQ
MRKEGKGVTMVVSPLLVLMENQIEAATKMGLRCDVLNSTVKDRRLKILNSLENDELDLILVTPETLFSDEVQKRLKNIKIGLFVIDEAHCISDWGHDFRLEYGNLKTVISSLPSTVPILATTATANDRVINDLEKQLGEDVFVSRGPLTRESLSIQALEMPDRITRYAWILENINKLPGSGIIYCLTQRDCDYLSDFLRKNGVNAEAYYSRKTEEGELLNKTIEERFRKNEIKAIVATIKLGMGYDKGDIAFIIHYQMPSNIVSYYQQIGRAGRSIDRAYTFLMFGKEDEDILNYFIKTAFPGEREALDIMEYISNNDGVKLYQINSALNIRKSRLDKAISFLMHDGFIRKEKQIYYATPKPFVYDKEHYDSVTATRIQEMEQMKKLATTNACYSRFVVECLDDQSAYDCGHCANCLGRDILPSSPSKDFIYIAEDYINGLVIDIEPRKMWVYSEYTDNKKISVPNKPGLCLAKYGDSGYGELVKRDKYSQKRFCDELVGKSAKVLRPLVNDKDIKYITCVPSLRSDIVLDFSMRLAESLGLTFVELLKKSDTRQQKEMQNSSYQCANAMRSFSLLDGAEVPDKVLLVDDVVDSRWTLTACGYYLSQGGCVEIYPFALADSSQKED